MTEEAKKERGMITAREMGQRGAAALKEKMKDDPDFYHRIGLLGGEKILREKGLEHFAKMGKIGGINCRDQKDPLYYHRLGVAGGAAMAKRGPEYFRMIGKRGLETRWGKEAKKESL